MRRIFVVLGLSAAVFGPLLASAAADAHGKEVRLAATCRPRDPATPLIQLCEARAVFAGDGEPVSGARLTLSARRLGRSAAPVTGLPLQPSGRAGSYSALVTLPAYGTWELTIAATSPAEGIVALTEQVLPPSLATSAAEGRTRLVISFGGRDLANVVFLGLHLLGAVLLLAASGAVLIGGTRYLRANASYRHAIARRFPPVAVVSMLLLALSGIYNAAYNAPARAPGLLHVGTVAHLPYGRAYVIAFAFKLMLAAVIFVNTVRLAVLVRRIDSCAAPVSGASSSALGVGKSLGPSAGRAARDPWLISGLVNVMAGGATLLTVVVIDYLHLLSHAGAFAGS